MLGVEDGMRDGNALGSDDCLALGVSLGADVTQELHVALHV